MLNKWLSIRTCLKCLWQTWLHLCLRILMCDRIENHPKTTTWWSSPKRWLKILSYAWASLTARTQVICQQTRRANWLTSWREDWFRIWVRLVCCNCLTCNEIHITSLWVDRRFKLVRSKASIFSHRSRFSASKYAKPSKISSQSLRRRERSRILSTQRCSQLCWKAWGICTASSEDSRFFNRR